MNNEYYGSASTPTEDFLAHYGVKGMKWGVRKAVSSGNDKALGRQYRKASKKLAKLEKRATSGKKYAKRAAALGVGAAAAGGLAAVGTRGIWNAMGKAGSAIKKVNPTVGNAIQQAGKSVGYWGGKASAVQPVHATRAAWNVMGKAGSAVKKINPAAGEAIQKAGKSVGEWGAKKAPKVSNNTIARVGAAALGAGLAGAAGYNAYRAATTKRAAKKAQQFRSEMNKAFAGTKYANGAPASTRKKKRNRG